MIQISCLTLDDACGTCRCALPVDTTIGGTDQVLQYKNYSAKTMLPKGALLPVAIVAGLVLPDISVMFVEHPSVY